MGLAAEHQGNSDQAMRQYNVAEKLWSEADKNLPELQILHKKLFAEQTELPQSRQEYLKRVGERPETPTSKEPANAAISFDPARLRGNPNASVIIVEFSDFQCPFCRKNTSNHLEEPPCQVRWTRQPGLQGFPFARHAWTSGVGSRICALRWRPGEVLGIP